MSSETEEQVLLPESRESSKKSYTRDFLLSFSELDVCKKLPDGFDASILSDFGDAGSTGFDQQRSLGSSCLQGSKRGEYGPVLQNRSESSGSYTRGGQGRWDTRSSGSSDKDTDVQSDRESVGQDSGRRFGNQTRRYWQNSEHDGLLGSGAFPRPTGYAGSSGPKARGNGPYQLNRSNEPYQPPRPYKAMPYSRKDGTDSYNDETFGSTECSSEDRAEEERKRRASFELMRKEQQKSLQEKHKPNLDNHKENLDADIIALLGNSAGENSMNKNKSDESAVADLSHSDSSRSSLHAQAPASRPLVPPGFRCSLVDKNLSVQSSSTLLESEAEGVIVENKHSLSVTDMDSNHGKGNIPVAFMPVNAEKSAPEVSSQLFIDANEMLMAPMLSAEVLKPTVDFEKISGKAAVQEANEVWEDDIVIMNDSSCKNGPASEMMNTVGQDNSTTILEKLFSSALSKTYASSPSTLEHHGVKDNEEKWSPALFESSKFAPWFSEEKKSEEDVSSRELLSLIVSNEKSGSQVPTSDAKASQHIPLSLTFESVGTPPKIPTSPATSSIIGVPKQYSQGDKKGQSSAVLTCEDLEQSILAEVKETSPSVHHVVRGGRAPVDGKSEEQKADIDDHASQHLLSLLQKGTSLKDSMSSPSPDIINSTDRYSGSHVHPSFGHTSDNVAVRNPEMVHSSEQTLTLEALFGASFMNALHSAEAPVSVQRGSTGTGNSTDVVQPHGVPFPSADEAFFSAISHESRSNKSIPEGDILDLSNTQKNHKIPGPWVSGYSDSPIEASKLIDSGIEEGGASEIQLPEEDSLITVGDVNPITTDPFAFENMHKPGEFLPENISVEDLNDKFLNTIFRRGERLRTCVSDGPTQLHKGPLEMVDSNDLYHHLHGRSSSHFPHQMDQRRPLFPPFDHLGHRNQQMKFAGPDGIHHDPHNLFPGNLIPHHAFNNMSGPRFDPAAAHHPMLQNMPVPGNFPPHHPMHSLPRGVPPSHPINHMSGYIHEMNNMHNFPLHNQQPNYGGGPGMGLPGPVVAGGGGGAHPEALERLIEMELRASSKQIHPPMGVHIPGIHGPENMNFRYR